MSRVKFQRRLLRGWVGYKPDRDGNFANIELRPVDSGNSISSNSGVAVTTSDVTKKSVSS